VSVIDYFTGQSREEERKRKLEQLAESMSKIAAEFGLTTDELTDALRDAVAKKRLRKTESDIAIIRESGARK